MPRYGIYGSHTPDARPIYIRKFARVFAEIADHDPDELAAAYGIRKIEARYHSALEHTFPWRAAGAEDRRRRPGEGQR